MTFYDSHAWVWDIPKEEKQVAAYSQNGYIADDRSVIRRYTVPGTDVVLALRQGACATVLLHVASQFDQLVESIDNARGHVDDWGYAERPIRGSTTVLSNHASGTAMDLNATRHPLGTSPLASFTARQCGAIHSILRQVGGVVRWGGDYDHRPDPMHFEIVTDLASVERIANRLSYPIPVPHPEDDMPLTDADAEKVAAALLNMTLGRSGPTVGIALQKSAQAAAVTLAEKDSS